MKNLLNIIGIVFFTIIFLITIVVIVLKVIIPIIKDIKKYKKLNRHDKDKYIVLAIIFYAPVILLFLDYFNIFSIFFPKYSNLSREYDWLSFIGTYSGNIVSAILLIFITEKDRDENTAVLRASQRPYLEIAYMEIDSQFFEDNNGKINVFEHGKTTDKNNKKKKYLTLCIKNAGASVAIIDTNKTKIKLSYLLNNRTEEFEFMLNFSINRLSIRSGEEIYIKFIKDELYKNGKLLNDSKIMSSTIYYKDLFNVNYYDECELKGDIKVLHDNEEIN